MHRASRSRTMCAIRKKKSCKHFSITQPLNIQTCPQSSPKCCCGCRNCIVSARFVLPYMHFSAFLQTASTASFSLLSRAARKCFVLGNRRKATSLVSICWWNCYEETIKPFVTTHCNLSLSQFNPLLGLNDGVVVVSLFRYIFFVLTLIERVPWFSLTAVPWDTTMTKKWSCTFGQA